jgi:hypothetical protein
VLLDRLDAENAIAAAARQDDTERIFAAVASERGEEHVDRRALVMGGVGRDQPKPPRGDRQDRRRRHDINLVLFERLIILRDLDAHLGVARQNLREEAFAIRRQMHDDDEAHARIGGHCAEQALQRLDAACGSADADDGEPFGRFHGRPFRLFLFHNALRYNDLRDVSISCHL